MTAFPEFSPRKARNGELFRINRHHLDLRPVQETGQVLGLLPRRGRDSTTIAVSNAFAVESKRVSDSLSSWRNFPRSGSPSRIASSAEVSMTTGTVILERTCRNTFLIVAQDSSSAPLVESRQGVHAL